MDNRLTLCQKIFVDIVKKDVPFALALRNNFKKVGVDKELSGDIKSLLGCTLRHFILFNHLIKEYFGELDPSLSAGLFFILANNLFLKRFDDKSVVDFAKKNLLDNDPNFDISKVDSFIKEHNDPKSLIPLEFKNGSNEYLSFRYNTPLWVVKMLTKQNGYSIALKVLKANYTPAPTTCRINTLVVNKDEVLSDKDFEETKVENIVTYVGKAPLMKSKFISSKGLFFEKLATKKIIDSLDLDPIRRIAIYSSLSNNIYLELVTKFGKNIELDIVNGHTQSYFEMKKEIEKYGLTNIRLFDESYKALYTSLSFPVHTFFVLPRNSMLDLLRSTPDYFLKLKAELLDGILLEQKETLENASKCVEEGGSIIYMIPTISNKEGKLMIADFLLAHPEFALIEEKQFYPFEEDDSCLFYANLKKIK